MSRLQRFLPGSANAGNAGTAEQQPNHADRTSTSTPETPAPETRVSEPQTTVSETQTTNTPTTRRQTLRAPSSRVATSSTENPKKRKRQPIGIPKQSHGAECPDCGAMITRGTQPSLVARHKSSCKGRCERCMEKDEQVCERRGGGRCRNCIVAHTSCSHEPDVVIS